MSLKGYKMVGVGTRSPEYAHRVRAEKALGKPLPPGAQVHHVDGDKDNPHARLVICENQAYHRLLHTRAKILGAGGRPDFDALCRYCRRVVPVIEAIKHGLSRARRDCAMSYMCRPCLKKRNAATQARRTARRRAERAVAAAA